MTGVYLLSAYPQLSLSSSKIGRRVNQMAEYDTQATDAICDLIAAGQLAEATRLCEDSLSRSPAKHAEHILQALSLTAAGSMHDAIARYEEALALAPDLLPAYLGIADILARQGWFSSAAVVMENARASARLTPTTQQRVEALHTRFVEASITLREPPT